MACSARPKMSWTHLQPAASEANTNGDGNSRLYSGHTGHPLVSMYIKHNTFVHSNLPSIYSTSCTLEQSILADLVYKWKLTAAGINGLYDRSLSLDQ